MQLNADIAIPAHVQGGRLDWVPSPTAGVDRRMLFRVGEEKARATSIVRYAPGSRFARHEHPGGEEFLVLEGTFQDETGDFPAGTYVRNPPGSWHAPGSESGCTIFVRLWQFRADDRVRIVSRPDEGKTAEVRPGVASARILFEGTDERVMLEDWQAGVDINLPNPQGLEVLVVAGSAAWGASLLERWNWLRLPAGQPLHVRVGPEGARVWYKSAPLLHRDLYPMPQSVPSPHQD